METGILIFLALWAFSEDGLILIGYISIMIIDELCTYWMMVTYANHTRDVLLDSAALLWVSIYIFCIFTDWMHIRASCCLFFRVYHRFIFYWFRSVDVVRVYNIAGKFFHIYCYLCPHWGDFFHASCWKHKPPHRVVKLLTVYPYLETLPLVLSWSQLYHLYFKIYNISDQFLTGKNHQKLDRLKSLY